MLDLTSSYNKTYRVLLYSSFIFLFLGFKFWLIHFYGNATPFWDQWDAEAATLYKFWNDGALTLKHLVEHHNEHRILTTRVLALLLLSLNKIWNPLLQMVVNAGLHLMAVLLFNSLLTKVLGRSVLPGLLAFSLLLFSVPFGWENTLVGFQGQFYFVLLFSIAAIWMLVTSEPLQKKWWGGVIMGILAFLSLASGLFVFATGTLVALIIYLLKLRTSKKQLISAAILAALFVTGFLLTPTLEHQQVYKAHTFADFYHSIKLVFGWPVGWNFLSVVIRNLPIGIFVLLMLRKRPAATDYRWFLFALCAWSVSQAISIAYGRAAGPLAPRYKDLHIIPIFVNFACVISLFQSSIGKWYRYALLGLPAWMAIVLFSISYNGFKYLPGELATKRSWNMAEEKNTRNYVATGNINYLKNTKSDMDIPYPRADRLAEIIEIPGVRELLPANIRKPLTPVSIENSPEGSFVLNGYSHKRANINVPDTAWGSYTTHKDTTTGSLLMKYKSNNKGLKIEIPVTGYPLEEGMKLEVIQNGHASNLKSPYNPEESWGGAYVRINTDEFSVHVTDSSKTSWVAVRPPVELGRLDGITTRILRSYSRFISIGLAIALVLIILAGMKKAKQNA